MPGEGTVARELSRYAVTLGALFLLDSVVYPLGIRKSEQWLMEAHTLPQTWLVFKVLLLFSTTLLIILVKLQVPPGG